MQGHIGQQGRITPPWGFPVRGVKLLIFHIPRLEPLLDEFPTRDRANGSKQVVVGDVVEGPLDVRIEHPLFRLVWAGQSIDFLDGIMATASRSEPVAAALESGFPGRFERMFDHGLKAAIFHYGNTERPEFAVGFGNVHPSGWLCLPRLLPWPGRPPASPVLLGS